MLENTVFHHLDKRKLIIWQLALLSAFLNTIFIMDISKPIFPRILRNFEFRSLIINSKFCFTVMSPRNAFSRTVSSPMRSSSRRTSAASSASTTPTATPLAPRRSSFTFAQQQRVSGIRRSSLSRASPSPVRRRTLTPGRLGLKAAPPPASYALALPRSLYGDDINGNTSNMMMTQSMDPAHLAARLDNNTTPTVLTQRDPLTQDLMTASLDPSMLVSIYHTKTRLKLVYVGDFLIDLIVVPV